jgi:lipid-binding SYLF domain-containing protein
LENEGTGTAYSRSRGLFAGVDLNGAALTQDKDETRILYGKFVAFDEILEGKVRPNTQSRPFLSELARYTGPGPAEAKPSPAQQ